MLYKYEQEFRYIVIDVSNGKYTEDGNFFRELYLQSKGYKYKEDSDIYRTMLIDVKEKLYCYVSFTASEMWEDIEGDEVRKFLFTNFQNIKSENSIYLSDRELYEMLEQNDDTIETTATEKKGTK